MSHRRRNPRAVLVAWAVVYAVLVAVVVCYGWLLVVAIGP